MDLKPIVGIVTVVAACTRHARPRPAPTRVGHLPVTFPEPAGPPRPSPPGPRDGTVLVGLPGDGHAPSPLANAEVEPLPLRLVLDAPARLPAGRDSLVHLVAFTPTMRPCAGADVYADARHAGRTDAHGTFVFRARAVPGHPLEGSFTVRCRSDTLTGTRTLAFHADEQSPPATRPTLHVHTDRGVYAPGQVVRARVLAWRLQESYAPVEGEVLELSLARGDGTALGGLRVVTDADGVALGEIPLGPFMPEGPHLLVAAAQGARAEAPLLVARSGAASTAPDASAMEQFPAGTRPGAATAPRSPERPLEASVPDGAIREGQPVALTVRFARHLVPVEDVVHGDVTDVSGAIVGAFLLPIAREGDTAVARGSFVAPAWGPLRVTLFAAAVPRATPDVAHVGLATEGLRAQVVPGAALELTLEGIPPHPRPGERLTLEARVHRDARPVDAVLGVALLDDTVRSVLDPFASPPHERFYDPERRVLDATGAPTLAWPVLQRSWAEPRDDLAADTTFGFHPGADPARDHVSPVPSPPRSAPAPRAPSPRPTLPVPRADGHPVPPRTAAWLPAVRVPAGTARFEITLPPESAPSSLTVLATDRRGGIGLARVAIPVPRGIELRHDLPRVLTEGDLTTVHVTARNTGDAPATARFALDSPGLAAAPLDPLQVELRPGGTAVARFRVVASTPGRFPAPRPSSHDTFDVRPAGNPILDRAQGSIAPGRPFVHPFARSSADRRERTTLAVVLPTLAALGDVLDDLQDSVTSGTEPIAAALTLTAALLHHRPPRESTVRAVLVPTATSALVQLLAAQNPDGGFGWSWDAPSSPFASTYVLESLLRARAAGLCVPSAALGACARYLLAALQAPELLPPRALAAWEGDAPRVRQVLAAQTVAALAALPPDARPADLARTLAPHVDRIEGVVRASDTEPLAFAHALRALVRYDALRASPPPRPARVAATERLLAARRDRHWEPGWFDAFGGGPEATAVALEALRALVPDTVTRVEHESREYLFASRATWGAWHHARATAFAIEALARMAPGTELAPGALTVRVDGRDVLQVPIDPSDPWAAAARLRHVVLDPWLQHSLHRVEVLTDGALAPRVTVTTERWPRAALRAGSLEASYHVPLTVRAGETFEVHAGATRHAPSRLLHLRLPLPPFATVDPASLRALMTTQVLSGYTLADDALTCLVAHPPRTVDLRIRLRVARPGRHVLPGMLVTNGRGETRRSAPSMLEVLPAPAP